MGQTKNTINQGDALKDRIDRDIYKRKVDGLFNGAKEADLTVKAYDFKSSEAVMIKLFNLPISGTVKVGWRLANIHDGVNVSLDTLNKPDIDWYIHFRPDGDNIVALAIPREKILPYWQQYGREIYRVKNGTVQIQLNTPSDTLPREGSKKWHQLMSFVDHYSTVDKIISKADDILSTVNEHGRSQASVNPSNPRNNRRKVGIPYKDR